MPYTLRFGAAVAIFVAAFLLVMSGTSKADDRFPPRDMAIKAHKAKHHHAKRPRHVRKAQYVRHRRTTRVRHSHSRAFVRRDPGGVWGAPARFIAGRLVCAVNVNAALAARGIRGTGSALAKSFLRWGRASRPVPGAVAVYSRRGGGHVAIVAKVERGRVLVWNPGRRGWRLLPYPRRAIAYRVPG